MPMIPQAMVILNEQRTPETTAFASLLTSCTVFSLAVAVIETYLAATGHETASPLFIVTVVAAALDCLVLGFLFVTLMLRLASRQWPLVSLWPFHISGCVVIVFADVLTIYTLARLRSPETHLDGQHQSRLAVAGIVVWSFAVITQLAFYGFTLNSLYSLGRVKRPASPREMMPPTQYPAKLPKRVHSLRLTVISTDGNALSSTAPDALPAAVSSPPESPLTSPRLALRQALRPISSKTKLLTRSPSLKDENSESSRPSSFSTLRERDGFESWDYKAASFEDLDTSLRGHHVRTRLEPIPGSRPASPAKALDGPFPERDQQVFGAPAPPFRLEAAALRSPSTVSVCSDSSSLPNGNSSNGHGPFMASRRPSTSQSNIHPLFRSESPVPPPVASPGTTIVASPFAGQVVSQEVALGSRRLHSAHSSRPGSVRSIPQHSPPLPDLTSLPVSAKQARYSSDG